MWLGVWQLLTSKHLSGLEQPKSAHNLKKQHCSPFPVPDHSYQLHFHIPITKTIANKATEYYCKKTHKCAKGQNKKLFFWITYEAIELDFKQKLV